MGIEWNLRVFVTVTKKKGKKNQCTIIIIRQIVIRISNHLLLLLATSIWLMTHHSLFTTSTQHSGQDIVSFFIFGREFFTQVIIRQFNVLTSITIVIHQAEKSFIDVNQLRRERA